MNCLVDLVMMASMSSFSLLIRYHEVGLIIQWVSRHFIQHMIITDYVGLLLGGKNHFDLSNDPPKSERIETCKLINCNP